MHGPIEIPARLRATCGGSPARKAWLRRVPATVRMLQRRWSLDIGAPFGVEASCAWVAPATRTDGTQVVLKLGMPHMEAEHEIDALRFWAGEPTVVLIDSDVEDNAMLLEACVPGTSLRMLPESEQDVVIADLLRRLWRRPVAPHPFVPLSVMTAHWGNAARSDAERWPDAGLAREGLRLFADLSVSAPDDVLLATDLHAGNVLAAQRAPWLVIDPKPFVGDRAYDATQHLFNGLPRVTLDLIRRFAGLLGVEHERVRLWMFARLVAEPRDDWSDTRYDLARALAP
jgi:streptomycin 6-kinase